MFLGVGTKDIH